MCDHGGDGCWRKFGGDFQPASKELKVVLDATRPTRDELLESNSKFDSEYGPFRFSNHLSHVIVALWGLGASSDLIRSFASFYINNTHPGANASLEPISPPFPLRSPDWTSILLRYRGNGSHYSALLSFFRTAQDRLVSSRVDQSVWEATHRLLVFYAPHLLQGVSGVAFHGLIQIGYGLEVNNPHTVVEGLAYSIQAYLSLGVPTDGPPSRSSSSSSSSSSFSFDPTSDLTELRSQIFTKYEGKLPIEVTREERFAKKIARSSVVLGDLVDSKDLGLENHIRTHFQEKDENSKKEIQELIQSVERKMADAINRVYACSNDDFFVLHLITSFRSLRLLLKAFDAPPAPFSSESAEEQFRYLLDNRAYTKLTSSSYELSLAKARMLDEYWRAVVCAYLIQGFPEINSQWWTVPDSSQIPDWEKIRAKAIDLATNEKGKIDEHTYKLAYVFQQDAAEGYFVQPGSREEKEKEEIDQFLRLVASRKVGLLPWALP